MKKPISRFYLLLVLVPLLLLASMGGYYFLEETAAGSDVVVVPQTPAPPSVILSAVVKLSHQGTVLSVQVSRIIRSRPPLPSQSMTLRSWLSGTT